MTAYADLAAGLGPHQLVPGQLAEIELMAISCAAYAEQLVRTRRAVHYIQVDGWAWTGKAADVYQAARVAHLDNLEVAAAAFEVAAQALASYATALRAARDLAAVAQADFHLAERARASCGTARLPPPPSPGVLRPVAPVAPVAPAIAVTLEGAVARLETARADVRTAGEAAAKALNEASAWSPAAIDPDPGFHLPSPGDLLRGLEEMPVQMATGPYHLVHGYLSTLLASAKGLGMAQYAGSRGITGPDYSDEYAAAQHEGLDGGLNTIGLLTAGEGAVGFLGVGGRALFGSSVEVYAATDRELVQEVASRVADLGGGALTPNKGGFTVRFNFRRGRDIVVRVMEHGGGRTNYYRVGVDGKAEYTLEGQASTDRGLTHIDIGTTSVADILRLVATIQKGE